MVVGEQCVFALVVPPWITSELKKRMHNRNILKIKTIISKDPFEWMQFKKQRNIRLAKRSSYRNSFNKYKVNFRKTWQTVNELTSRKSGKESDTPQFLKPMDNKHNSLHLAAKICSDICPRALSVARSEQFSESEARGKLSASRNR